MRQRARRRIRRLSARLGSPKQRLGRSDAREAAWKAIRRPAEAEPSRPSANRYKAGERSFDSALAARYKRRVFVQLLRVLDGDASYGAPAG